MGVQNTPCFEYSIAETIKFVSYYLNLWQNFKHVNLSYVELQKHVFWSTCRFSKYGKRSRIVCCWEMEVKTEIKSWKFSEWKLFELTPASLSNRSIYLFVICWEIASVKTGLLPEGRIQYLSRQSSRIKEHIIRCHATAASRTEIQRKSCFLSTKFKAISSNPIHNEKGMAH